MSGPPTSPFARSLEPAAFTGSPVWSASIEVVRLEGSDEPEFRRNREWEANARSPKFVSKLRHVEVLQGQGILIADAVRQIGVTQQTYNRWRKINGGMGREQLKRLKELEKEHQRLRRAVSDLTLDSEALKPPSVRGEL